jgi:uncharacterized membrane protein YphA (DoxX/SURF4 family)
MKVLFLIGRIVFGGFFLISGFFDLRHYRFFVPLVAGSGVPFPRFAVIFAGLLILLGGICVVVGFRPRAGVSSIILFLVLVTPVAHAFWAHRDKRQHADDLNNFTKNMGLLGGSLMTLLIPEPWPYSLDRAVQMRRKRFGSK